MSTPINNESVQNLLADLGIDAGYTSPSLEALAATDSKYLRDLRLNVGAMLKSSNVTRKEGLLLSLSVAINEKRPALIAAFEALATKEGATPDEIAETHACASIMTLNNTFYRFRHYLDEVEYYNKQPAGLRMSIMMNPSMGKALFELMSLVISAVNGCEKCVISHERSVRELGAGEPRIYDAVRLGATIKGLCTVI